MNSSERVAAKAEALVGVRFRPQGRSSATGLDCIGLAAAALDVPPARRDYALRGGSLNDLRNGLQTAGMRQVRYPKRGDILILQPGPAQLHLAVFTGNGIVHADARLRRVVERPGIVPWSVLGVWRVK